MRHILWVVYLSALIVAAGCGRINRGVPPAPGKSSAISARNTYGMGVGKAFRKAARLFREGKRDEESIIDQMTIDVQDLPEAAWEPLMREMNKAPDAEAKAKLCERWAVELGGGE